MTKDKFIWRDPLDSEEAKQMEEEAKQIEEDNVVFSCPHHGKETYFKIKALERRPSMQDYVYVWFKHRGYAEKMWVRITRGDRSKGQGRLDNQPIKLMFYKLGDIIKFKTDADGITWGK